MELWGFGSYPCDGAWFSGFGGSQKRFRLFAIKLKIGRQGDLLSIRAHCPHEGLKEGSERPGTKSGGKIPFRGPEAPIYA